MNPLRPGNRHGPRRLLFRPLLPLLLVVAFAASAGAHRVNVFAWVEGGRVRVECKYPDGRPVNAGTIRVTDSGGAVLLSGKTNAAGEFAFAAPRAERLTVVLEAGMGHRAQWEIPGEDLAPGGGRPQAPAGPSAAAGAVEPPKTAPPPAAADIEQAIETALERKLAPVVKMLAESQSRGPGVSDILGGLGYIVGLVGIGAYFKRRPPEGGRG